MIRIIFGILLGLLLIALVYLFYVLQQTKAKVSYLERRYMKLLQGNSVANMETFILKRFAEIDILKKSTRTVADSLDAIGDACENAIQKVGLVKYDAFEDIGGNRSFALALLNRNYSGVVLNAIHGKDGCYTYVKEITEGKPVTMLTEEEMLALEKALRGGKTLKTDQQEVR